MSNLRVKKVQHSDSIIQLDTLSIYPGSFSVLCDGVAVPGEEYELSFATAELILRSKCASELLVVYRVFTMDLSKVYSKRDTSVIYNRKKGDRENYLISSTNYQDDIFGGAGLTKSGSISRGISFGNN